MCHGLPQRQLEMAAISKIGGQFRALPYLRKCEFVNARGTSNVKKGEAVKRANRRSATALEWLALPNPLFGRPIQISDESSLARMYSIFCNCHFLGHSSCDRSFGRKKHKCQHCRRHFCEMGTRQNNCLSRWRIWGVLWGLSAKEAHGKRRDSSGAGTAIRKCHRQAER